MIKAKKKFGQNFLKDNTIIEKIVQSMPNDNLRVVEIGPGLGDLTKKLIKFKTVTAFEIDDDLCQILKSNFSSYIKDGRLNLKCIDVLRYWKERNLLNQKYNLIANLPYYIATKIILKSIEDESCRNILVMIQKEVAEKFCAKPGDKEYGYISIISELSSKREILFDVLPECFDPAPKVISSILRIEKKEDILGKNKAFVEQKEFEKFKKFLKICFTSPRKTLKKNLSIYDKDMINSIFEKLDIELNTRPHQLSSKDYLKLFLNIKNK